MTATVYNAAAATLQENERSRYLRVDAQGRLLQASPENASTAALITHTAAAAGVNGADQTNPGRRGVQLGINITALGGVSPTLTVTIQGKDPVSGQYYNLLTSAAIAATGFTLLTVYPGAPATANVSAPQSLPLTWRVITAIGGTTPAVTATVAANLLI